MSTKNYFDNHIISADSIDQRDLEIIEDDSPVMAELKQRGHELVNNNFPNLVDDLFQSFYQYSPELRQRIPEHLARNQMFLEELVTTPDYSELRVSTKNDDFASALAAINLTENLLEKLEANEDLREQFKQQPALPPEKREKKQKEQQEDEKEEGEGQDEGSGEGEGQGEGQGEGEGSGEGQGQGQGEGNSSGQGNGPQQDADADDVKDEVSDQQDSEAEMSEQEQAQREAQARTLRAIIREAADKTNEELASVEAFTIAYGTDPAELKKMSFSERREFIKRIKDNKHLVELAQRVGRFQRMLKKAKMERTTYAKQEVVGVTRSNDVQRMTPTEHAMRKKAPLDWKRRYTQRNLQTYKLEGLVPMGKGPVVICIDKSDSMDYGYPKPDQWATAVMFAIIAEAAKDKRSVHVCFFNAHLKHTQTLVGGKYGIPELIKLTEIAPNGGTNFDLPLTYAYERVKEDKEMRQADIIFITDGGCRISPDVKASLMSQREKQDISLFTILIGMDRDSQQVADLTEISDEVHTMDDLKEENKKTASAFARMANNTRL